MAGAWYSDVLIAVPFAHTLGSSLHHHCQYAPVEVAPSYLYGLDPHGGVQQTPGSLSYGGMCINRTCRFPHLVSIVWTSHQYHAAQVRQVLHHYRVAFLPLPRARWWIPIGFHLMRSDIFASQHSKQIIIDQFFGSSPYWFPHFGLYTMMSPP